MATEYRLPLLLIFRLRLYVTSGHARYGSHAFVYLLVWFCQKGWDGCKHCEVLKHVQTPMRKMDFGITVTTDSGGRPKPCRYFTLMQRTLLTGFLSCTPHVLAPSLFGYFYAASRILPILFKNNNSDFKIMSTKCRVPSHQDMQRNIIRLLLSSNQTSLRILKNPRLSEFCDTLNRTKAGESSIDSVVRSLRIRMWI